jgi:hypothetical protein
MKLMMKELSKLRKDDKYTLKKQNTMRNKEKALTSTNDVRP